jgi:hypothetical protein
MYNHKTLSQLRFEEMLKNCLLAKDQIIAERLERGNHKFYLRGKVSANA